MARFGVYRLPDDSLVLDCQSDYVDHLGTRLVVPLLHPGTMPAALPALHPCFDIDGERLMMATHLAGAVHSRLLKNPVTMLHHHHHAIMRTIDTLLTGF
ncbi:CcdB family protein [Sphingobium limneticum]|uniref:Toxin CcdB n=1 Tax=Sphingobium limneticum TaxID=1007511 RepID=A0A5J5HWM8_9SPHN|nr:CcdB family protein [Sphingobium limneticum]KAA9014292.1 plasmid maintenance protein CcdB [Sphingobium limneticum]KAA9027381.1 plasmid maintenance protein CcdB [Sphingobium limneticum]